ncbi:MAG: hypothetical protein M3510_03820 [Actinomycetota bacterium]|nr:hypothetical protein [Actinomycetota bacterium]
MVRSWDGFHRAVAGLSAWLVARPYRAVLAAVAGALLLRAPFVLDALEPDEAGYLLVARKWTDAGSSLYGELWVDRPPLLLLFFRAADALSSAHGVRLLGALTVVALIALAGWAGWLVQNNRGAAWAACTAAALTSSPLLGAQEVDGELVAAPLIMLSCAAVLTAAHNAAGGVRRLLWAGVAGVAGASAVAVKQNLVDGLVFAAVLLVAAAVQRSVPRADAAQMLVAGLAGALVPVAATVAWAATTGPGVGGLVFALYGFRSRAFDVVADHGLQAPALRLALLLLFTLLSGAALLVWSFLRARPRDLHWRQPLDLALVAMLLTGTVGIALGASYWSHYLIGLVPVLALISARVAEWPQGDVSGGELLWRRRVVGLTASACTAVAVVTGWGAVTTGPEASAVSVGRWVGSSASGSDRLVVTYGHANVVEESGLGTAYPYLWSLPVRTLDPHLRMLAATLGSSGAPAWVVEWDDVNAWGIDDEEGVRAVLARDYREVASVCGHVVYLHLGVRRALAPVSTRCGGL